MFFKKTIKVFVIGSMLGVSSFAQEGTSPHPKPGTWFLKPIALGGRIHFVAEPQTPGWDYMLKTGAEYVLDRDLNLTLGLTPFFSPKRFGLGISGGGKYRFTQLRTPFTAYVGGDLKISVRAPYQHLYSQWNLGIRPFGGLDYYIHPHFILGLEFAFEPSIMLSKAHDAAFEMSVETLLGFSMLF